MWWSGLHTKIRGEVWFNMLNTNISKGFIHHQPSFLLRQNNKNDINLFLILIENFTKYIQEAGIVKEIIKKEDDERRKEYIRVSKELSDPVQQQSPSMKSPNGKNNSSSTGISHHLSHHQHSSSTPLPPPSHPPRTAIALFSHHHSTHLHFT
jgi:hypothetical protein